MMTTEELKTLAALPEKLEVYRGCNPVKRDGFSWTLDRSNCRMVCIPVSSIKGQPLLLTATIERSMITAVNLSRKGDREVILLYMPGGDEVKEVSSRLRHEHTQAGLLPPGVRGGPSSLAELKHRGVPAAPDRVWSSSPARRIGKLSPACVTRSPRWPSCGRGE